MEQLITAALFKQTGATAAKLLKGLLKVPPQPSPSHVLFEHFWVERGSTEPSRSVFRPSTLNPSVIVT
jgi:midasin